MGLCHNNTSTLQRPATTKHTMFPDIVAYLWIDNSTLFSEPIILYCS